MFDTSLPGPFYEDFVIGATLPVLPGVTLTEGDNSLYRAITGDQHRMAADSSAYRASTGRAGKSLANPGLVMQCSIGQTTMATRQAIANLYYRSVRILRAVELGETLTTTTTVLGLADSTPKGDQYRGKVWLGIETTADNGPVARYERCALVRGRKPGPGHATAIPGPSDPTPLAEIASATPSWDLSAMPTATWSVGATKVDSLRDHIDMAAPLARMTFNQAAVHRDHALAADGRRLVYGGHVQGLAQASLTRMLPGLTMVVAWDGCDHMAPAHEGNLLEFRHTLLETADTNNARLLRFDVIGTRCDDDGTRTDLLRWTPIVLAP